MILVLAGTKDGREIAAQIENAGYSVLVSVVSEYGRSLVEEQGLVASASSLDATGLAGLIRERGIKVVIDATHPYASAVSSNAIEASKFAGTKYLRYERMPATLPAYGRLHTAKDAAEAAVLAADLGKVIFLTTGSRALKIFKTEPRLAGHRLVARVLPEPAVLDECLAIGFLPRDIVAVQGPFSRELNIALFKEYGSDVVVTKNSGLVGGSDEKFNAAVELGLHLVVIDRPEIDYPTIVNSGEAVISFIKEILE
ncbi:MAG: cobK [Firmicutes bacterium]|nr:cobK [Bacillota bacterium]